MNFICIGDNEYININQIEGYWVNCFKFVTIIGVSGKEYITNIKEEEFLERLSRLIGEK